MIEAASRQDLGAWISTTGTDTVGVRSRIQVAGPIVRVVNVRWRHRGPIGFDRLRIEVGRAGTDIELFSALRLLSRARVIEGTPGGRVRLTDDARRGMS